jgi:hypothetical protein
VLFLAAAELRQPGQEARSVVRLGATSETSVSRIDDGLRGVIRAHLRMVHWTTIETGLTEQGVPDLHGCWRGVDLWIECKAASAWAVTVRPAQVGWHLRRTRNGGVSWFAVRRRADGGPRRGPAVDELILVRGSAARQLRTSGLRDVEQIRWGGGPARWDWDAVLAALLAG